MANSNQPPYGQLGQPASSVPGAPGAPSAPASTQNLVSAYALTGGGAANSPNPVPAHAAAGGGVANVAPTGGWSLPALAPSAALAPSGANAPIAANVPSAANVSSAANAPSDANALASAPPIHILDRRLVVHAYDQLPSREAKECCDDIIHALLAHVDPKLTVDEPARKRFFGHVVSPSKRAAWNPVSVRTATIPIASSCRPIPGRAMFATFKHDLRSMEMMYRRDDKGKLMVPRHRARGSPVFMSVTPQAGTGWTLSVIEDRRNQPVSPVYDHNLDFLPGLDYHAASVLAGVEYDCQEIRRVAHFNLDIAVIWARRRLVAVLLGVPLTRLWPISEESRNMTVEQELARDKGRMINIMLVGDCLVPVRDKVRAILKTMSQEEMYPYTLDSLYLQLYRPPRTKPYRKVEIIVDLDC